MTVAEGATLTVDSDETIDSLAGPGTVEVAQGVLLTVNSLRGFTGTLTGYGVIAVGKGSSLDRSRVTIANTLTVRILDAGMAIFIR